MTPTPTLTPAQKRALLWLPADGSFVRTSRKYSASLSYLREFGLAEFKRVSGARYYGLTPAGIVARTALGGE